MKKKLSIRFTLLCFFSFYSALPTRAMEVQLESPHALTPLDEFKSFINQFVCTDTLEMLHSAYEIYGKLRSGDKRLAEIYAKQSGISLPENRQENIAHALFEKEQTETSLNSFLVLLANTDVKANNQVYALMEAYQQLSQEDKNQAQVFLDAQLHPSLVEIIKKQSSSHANSHQALSFSTALENYEKFHSNRSVIALLRSLSQPAQLDSAQLRKASQTLQSFEIDTSEQKLTNWENKLENLLQSAIKRSKRMSW